MIDARMIERLADAAWPAAEQVPLGPWVLRATHGVTRRANSVFTAAAENIDGQPLEDLVEAAEGFYARRSLPAIFQISAATGANALDALLARRGYALNGASEVWTAEADQFSAPPAGGAGWALCRDDEPDVAWFDCAFDESTERRRLHEQIVRRVPRPREFVSARADDGTAVGCGMAVSAEGHAGIFTMATSAPWRRRGVALSLLGELCAWARSRGDERIYLQVMCENEAAKALYRRAGFAFAYGYHYRVR